MKNNNPAAVALGSIKTERKAKAARINGAKGGRPKSPLRPMNQDNKRDCMCKCHLFTGPAPVICSNGCDELCRPKTIKN